MLKNLLPLSLIASVLLSVTAHAQKILSILLILSLFSGSALAQSPKPKPTPKPKQKQKAKPRVGDISNPEAETPPFIGMTKAQALARYGKPKKHTLTDEGEHWVYLLNYGEMIGKAFIPFNFKPTVPRTGVLIFGSDERVKKFNWDAEIKR